MRWIRASVVRVIDWRADLVLVGTDGTVQRLDGDTAALARALLDFLAAPRSHAEIVAHIESLTGEPLTNVQVVDQVLDLLRGAGALREVSQPAKAPAANVTRRRLVLGVTGAVASLNAPALITLLQRRGFEVRVALTRAARRFVQPTGLAALTHHRVYQRMFGPSGEASVPHVELAEWADAVLIYPASGSALSRLAGGDFSELVSAIALTTQAPVVVVPSMNVAMYQSPAVQRNLDLLRQDGLYLVHPAFGVEVAHAPQHRVPLMGAAPPIEEVADMLEVVLRLAPARARSSAAQPWDEVYRNTPAEALPWHSESLEAPLAAALAGCARPGALALDVGTGLGLGARALAGAGMHVVATDISETALELARARAAGLPIAFVRDDITDTRLAGGFHVALDRGCLHTLPPGSERAWATAMARLVSPGGRLLLAVHDHDGASDRGTRRYRPDELAQLVDGAFEVEKIEPARFAGPSEPPQALFCTLRRL